MELSIETFDIITYSENEKKYIKRACCYFFTGICIVEKLHNISLQTSIGADVYRRHPMQLRQLVSDVVTFPEAYPKIRSKIEQELADSGQIKSNSFRVARQAQLIDTLLEISNRDFFGFSDAMPDESKQVFIDKLQLFFSQPNKKLEARAFGIIFQNCSKGFLLGFVKNGIAKHILSNNYKEVGFNPDYVLGLFFLNLAIQSSNILNDQTPSSIAFNQAVLDMTAPNSPLRKGYILKPIKAAILKNFNAGIITPPPINDSIKQAIKEMSPDENFESNDPQYYYELIKKTSLHLGGVMTQYIRTNPIWTRTFLPAKYIRYKEIFDFLNSKHNKEEIKSILEMGCSTFGAAMAMLDFFPKAHVLGCDLKDEADLRSSLQVEVSEQFDVNRLSYRKFDIRSWPQFTGEEFSNRQFDLVTLLNSAYPHLNSTTPGNPFLGRVAAIESGLRLARKNLVIAGGDGLHHTFSSVDPKLITPINRRNGWIFTMNKNGGVDVEGVHYS